MNKGNVVKFINETFNLYQLFEFQSKEHPNSIALIFEEESLTYKEMELGISKIAAFITNLNLEHNSPIALKIHKSINMILIIYAILKSGHCYVPIDTECPDSRLNSIIDDAGIRLIFTDDAFGREYVDRDIKVITVPKDIERMMHQLPEIDSRDSKVEYSNSSNAYIIYTSGSTGRPKGVQIQHYGVVNRLMSMARVNALTADDVFFQKTPYFFDVSVYEIFLPMMLGARLVVSKDDGYRDQRYMQDMIQKERITILRTVPSLLSLFLENCKTEKLESLRCVICSGEELRLGLKERFFQILSKCDLYNFYGPTEASIDVTWYNCKESRVDNLIPIGMAFDNVNLYILDESMSEVSDGTVGELFIGGTGLSSGYINRDDLTAERFINNPFIDGEKLYKTGDLTRTLADGNIQYLGRNDFQVKINGLRIEMQEVEISIAKIYQNARTVIVIPNEQMTALLAFIVCTNDCVCPEDIIKAGLLNILPKYMVPQSIICTASIPLTANGKVDRRALLELYNNNRGDRGDISRFNDVDCTEISDLELKILKIWKELFKSSQIEIDINLSDDFFNIGGDSLLALHLVIALEMEFNIELENECIYSNRTIKDLAVHINSRL